MERPDIERILQGVLGARAKNPKNEILKDFEAVLIYVTQLESAHAELQKVADADHIEAETSRTERGEW